MTDLAAENRYALTRLGHDLLAEALDGVELPPFRAAPRIDGRSVLHLDLLNSFRISLALGAPNHGFELRAFVPDWELRAKDPLASLVPDAVVILSIIGRPPCSLVFALEVDTGAEAASLVLRKLERYRERHALGQKCFGFSPAVVLFLTETERRAKTLARHVVESGSQGATPSVLFTTTVMAQPDGGVVSGVALPKALVAAESAASAFRSGLARLAV